MDVVGFALHVQTLNTLSAVSQALSDLTRPLGYPTHAISPVPTPDRPVEDAMFLVQNWPDRWGQAYEAEGFAAFDPVPRAASTLSAPITIAEIRAGKAGFQPDARSARMFALAAELDRPHGLLCPVFGPNGYRAIVCYAGTRATPSEDDRIALRMVGIAAHDRIRDIVHQGARAMGQITAREIDVLRLAAAGHSDAETAAQLGISVRTVRFHMGNARTKLNASSRTQAIVMATGLGLLGG